MADAGQSKRKRDDDDETNVKRQELDSSDVFQGFDGSSDDDAHSGDFGDDVELETLRAILGRVRTILL